MTDTQSASSPTLQMRSTLLSAGGVTFVARVFHFQRNTPASVIEPVQTLIHASALYASGT